MPEGPEIHAQVLRLRRALQGQLVQVESEFPALQTGIARVQGQRLERVEARGKAFLLSFEGGLTLYAHMQLYGRWKVVAAGKSPRTRRQLRIRLGTAARDALLYSATDVAWLDSQQLATHPYLGRLGPDLLDSGVGTKELLVALLSPRFARRQLGALLLDQSFWAGPGNYLRSEILFCAGLSPQHRPAQLTPRQSLQLCRVAQGLARRSLASGGVTGHPDWVARLKKERQPRRLYRHWVFGRAGQDCLLCGRPILKEMVTSRRFYRCSGCQGGEGLALDFSDGKGQQE